MDRLSCLLCELKDKSMLLKRVAKYLPEGKIQYLCRSCFSKQDSLVTLFLSLKMPEGCIQHHGLMIANENLFKSYEGWNENNIK